MDISNNGELNPEGALVGVAAVDEPISASTFRGKSYSGALESSQDVLQLLAGSEVLDLAIFLALFDKDYPLGLMPCEMRRF